MALDIPLKNIAKSIRNIASATAPRDTGKLRNALRAYNTPERMIKTKKNGSFELTFYNAPPTATYGKYWNSPYGVGNGTTATIKRRYPQHFDYGDKALKDTEVKDSIKNYINAVGKQIATQLRDTIRKELGAK